MRRIVASLAAALAAPVLGACGGGGAEPDAPAQRGADHPTADAGLEMVLDFRPNAVHAGIYRALGGGLLAERGIELTVREPGASTDAPKLLRSGRADLAILDIHDLAIAREQGIDLVGIGAIAQRPLAAVIARDREAVRGPADLAGARVGVTGLPSDEAVLGTVLEAGGLDPGDVETVTIGFESVAALAAGRVDAATAFWSSEGVALRRLGVPTRELRVEEFGAPAYPELVLVTTPELVASAREPLREALAGIEEGYALTAADPDTALDELLGAVPGLDRGAQRSQLEAVLPALARELDLDREVLQRWAGWVVERGIVASRPDVGAAFELGLAR